MGRVYEGCVFALAFVVTLLVIETEGLLNVLVFGICLSQVLTDAKMLCNPFGA